MKFPRLSPLALATFTLLAAPAVRAAETHTVNLTTPWTVGQAFSVKTTFTETTRASMTVGDKPAPEQSRKRMVRLEADAEALKVHPNGGLRQASYTVRDLRIIENSAPPTVYLPAGTKLVVEQVGVSDKSVTVDGKPATPEQLALLKPILAADGEHHNDQLIFGPDKPVAVGESWSINSATFISSLGSELGEIGAATGTMKLDGYSGEGAQGVALVSGQTSLVLTKAPLPPGFTMKSGKMTFRLDGRIPAGRSAAERQEKMSGAFELLGETAMPDGGVAQIKMRSDITTDVTLRFR